MEKSDLKKMYMAEKGHHYLLIANDHFSSSSILISMEDKVAKTVATAVINEVFYKFTSSNMRKITT